MSKKGCVISNSSPNLNFLIPSTIGFRVSICARTRCAATSAHRTPHVRKCQELCSSHSLVKYRHGQAVLYAKILQPVTCGRLRLDAAHSQTNASITASNLRFTKAFPASLSGLCQYSKKFLNQPPVNPQGNPPVSQPK